MSFLSDLSRAFTGQSIGSNVGAAVGGAFGGKVGAVAGASVGDKISSGLSNISGGTDQGQSVAISQATQTNPQENMTSGTNVMMGYGNGFQQASFGSFPSIPNMPSTMQSGIQPAVSRSLLAIGAGVVVGAIDLFFNDPVTGELKRKKITRKFKSQVKQSVELVGLEETANMLNTSPDTIVQILLKRFRNDGPYITKAAVRKTRATVRKMETVNSLSKEIAKLAGSTTRRATTTRRASTAASRKTTVIQ